MSVVQTQTNLPELLDRYGCPAYVYELEELRAASRDLKAALPEEVELLYSLKANPHPAVVAVLRRLGYRAEVSSTGELRTAMEAGVPASQCLYTGPAKTPGEIALAMDRGVDWFSVDSPRELRKVADAAEVSGRRVNLLLRVNADESVGGGGLAMTGEPSQFGADASWVLAEPGEFTAGDHAPVRGFHCYMGTNVFEDDVLLRMFETGTAMAAELAGALGIEVEILDLGGGFGHPFAESGERPQFPKLRSELESLLDRDVPGWREQRPKVKFESGRYLTGGMGTLLCTVQDVKESKGRRFVLLDSGIHHLGGMSGLRRVPRISPELEMVATGDGDQPSERQGEHESDLVGPLCTPLDSWARGIPLEDVEPGDVVAVPNVGAYGLTGSLIGFLSHEAPVEIVLDHGRVVEVSRLSLSRVEQSRLGKER